MSFYQLCFESRILQKNVDILISSPNSPEPRGRVVYLLHGGGGGGGTDNKVWLSQKERLQDWAEKFQMTFLMPSAPDSFFANTCEGIRYQDYMLQELLPKMPNLLNITSRREWTAVAGMSMGGTSAFRLGLAAPEWFGAIGCLCSGNLWMDPLSNRVHSYAVKHVFGVNKIEEIQGTQYDFFVDALRNVHENRPLPRIFHACGKQDHALNHAHLTAKWFQENAPEYDYVYQEPFEGGHDDNFWAEWMPVFLRFFTG